MIDARAIYTEVLSGILNRIPGGHAFFQNIGRRVADNAGAARAVADQGQASQRPWATSDPIPFSALVDFFGGRGSTDPAIRQVIEAEIEAAALRNNLDPNLVRAVVRAESSYRPDAVSSAGAMGLMQLMPGTAQWLGVTNPFDIRQNIDGGTRYLRHLLDMFGGINQFQNTSRHCFARIFGKKSVVIVGNHFRGGRTFD